MAPHRRENEWGTVGEIIHFVFEVLFQVIGEMVVAGIFQFLSFIFGVLLEAISGL